MLSCFTNSYGRFGPAAAMEWLPRAGIRHVELAIKTAGAPSPFGETPLLTDASTAADLARVQRLLEDAGVRLSSCNISSGNPFDDVVVARTIAKLRLAAALGVGLAVGGAGEAPDNAWPRLRSQLQRIGDAAAELGIVYCCETHPGACQNADAMVQTMHAVDHPHVRLNFDTGNLYFYNRAVDLEGSLRTAAPWVRHVHLKDSPGGYQQWHFTELGGGIVDFRLVRTVLMAAGFDGPWSLEIEGIQGEPPLTLAQHHDRVQRSVEHLRDCGW